MKSKILSILISTLLVFVTVASVTGTQTSDTTENMTISSGPTMRTLDIGDILIDFDAQTAHGENGVLGAEWDGNYFWTSSRGLTNPPHKFFVWDIDGNLVATYNQPTQSSTWGIRDLAYDGTYLYGGSENGFWQIDPSDGSTTLLFSSISPMTCIRALAWVPTEGKFYSGNFGESWYKFSPNGADITAVANPGLTAVYGMAYNDMDDTIWIFDQTGTPQTTFFEYDYLGGTLTGNSFLVPLLTGNTAQLAGGAFYATDCIPGVAVLGGMVQGTPLDRLFCLDWGITNLPPVTPDAPDGPDEGVTGVEYTFEASTWDPEGDDIYYKFDWGNGEQSGWIGPYSNNVTAEGSYTWADAGDYDVKVKAKDASGETDWSDAHAITILGGPILDIRPVSSGLLKVKVSIKNDGATEAANVDWSITLDGGVIILGKETTGTLASIPAGSSQEVSSGLIFGFGKTTIIVTADVEGGVSDVREQGATVLLFFIYVKPGGG